MIVSFLIDALYFKRSVFWHDIVGASIILIFAVSQCLLADAAAEEEKKKQKSDLSNDDPIIKNNEAIRDSGNIEDGAESVPLIIKE